MHIRNYETKDFEECKQILQEIHNLHAKNRPDIYNEIELSNEFIQEMFSDINLVAIEENKVIGILIASIKQTIENEMIKRNPIIWIEGIGVQKEYQGKGIGTELLNELEKLASEQEISKIELNVWNFNEHAIDFYKKLGYQMKNMRLEKSDLNEISNKNKN